MIALVTYWRDQCFDAYEALIEIERCARNGASSEVIAHLARAALQTQHDMAPEDHDATGS